jgi:hypothetical protein
MKHHSTKSRPWCLVLRKPPTVLSQPKGSSICSRLIMLMRQPDGAWSASQLRIDGWCCFGLHEARSRERHPATRQADEPAKQKIVLKPLHRSINMRSEPHRIEHQEQKRWVPVPLSHHHHAGHPGFAMTRDQARELVLAGCGESPQ